MASWSSIVLNNNDDDAQTIQTFAHVLYLSAICAVVVQISKLSVKKVL